MDKGWEDGYVFAYDGDFTADMNFFRFAFVCIFASSLPRYPYIFTFHIFVQIEKMMKLNNQTQEVKKLKKELGKAKKLLPDKGKGLVPTSFISCS